MTNPYLHEVLHALPQVLARFDTDPTRDSRGTGDRGHWAWGLRDHANGTFQGAVSGLALLWRHGLWPYTTARPAFLNRLDTIVAGTTRIMNRDGSLDEAMPREGSWCVTALVANDILCALKLLRPHLDAARQVRWRETAGRLIAYLMKHEETHAAISNHLATGALALARWHQLTRDETAGRRAREILNRILAHQSGEGWFMEYGGADPGYQSLATAHLAELHRLRPDWELREPLRRSVGFLWHFAHPDGSFGGLYGSRSTRFYFPAGLELLASDFPEAAALAATMRVSIAERRVVTLAAMDEGNLVPMFNDYCFAATLYGELPEGLPVLPARSSAPVRKIFPAAGLLVDGGPRHYTVIATGKGGVIVHFRDGELALLDAGVVVRERTGRLASTQALDRGRSPRVEGDSVIVEASFVRMARERPGTWQFMLLRLLSLTLFRVPASREWVKRRLVARLITARNVLDGSNTRTIRLGADLAISDAPQLPRGATRVNSPGAFVAIHMASQGYWQIQDEA